MNADYTRGPHRGGTTDALWADALPVPCSYCGAPVETKCHNVLTKETMPVPHWHRLSAAEKTQ